MRSAARATSSGSFDSTMSTTSNRPSVAKLCLQVTFGHCLRMRDATLSASFLNSLGSSNASGESLLRMTYIAMLHLLVCLLSHRPREFDGTGVCEGWQASGFARGGTGFLARCRHRVLRVRVGRKWRCGAKFRAAVWWGNLLGITALLCSRAR